MSPKTPSLATPNTMLSVSLLPKFVVEHCLNFLSLLSLFFFPLSSCHHLFLSLLLFFFFRCSASSPLTSVTVTILFPLPLCSCYHLFLSLLLFFFIHYSAPITTHSITVTALFLYDSPLVNTPFCHRHCYFSFATLILSPLISVTVHCIPTSSRKSPSQQLRRNRPPFNYAP